MTDIKDEEASTDPMSLLARELDETRLPAFSRCEMWQFLLDIGWTNGSEAPPCRANLVVNNDK